MSIGSPETARRLYTHYNGDMDLNKRAPNGFRRIGEGCYRMAVLEKATDVVYKIGAPDCNLREAENARRLARRSTRSLGFELRIPRTRTYRMPKSVTSIVRNWYGSDANVAVQEYATNAKHSYCAMEDSGWLFNCKCTCKRELCFATVINIVAEFTGLEDMHSGNILVDKNNVFWLIDLAD